MGLFADAKAFTLTCCVDADMAVRRHAADSHVLARRSRVPQGDALHLPGRHRAHHQQEQPSARRGVDGLVQGLLLHHHSRLYTDHVFKTDQVTKERLALSLLLSF